MSFRDLTTPHPRRLERRTPLLVLKGFGSKSQLSWRGKIPGLAEVSIFCGPRRRNEVIDMTRVKWIAEHSEARQEIRVRSHPKTPPASGVPFAVSTKIYLLSRQRRARCTNQLISFDETEMIVRLFSAKKLMATKSRAEDQA